MKKITLVDADDWHGLYLDGVLVKEGHEIEIQTVLSLLDIDFDRRTVYDWDELAEIGSLPEKLDEVVFDAAQ